MMYRMTRQAPFRLFARGADARSPFVRLRELLDDVAPGKPAISMAVGEPQHPIPAFVGPVIAAHVEEFGRYPMNKGIEPFAEAVGKWLDRRYALTRPVDPATEVLVLNGTREGLFLAALAAKRWVSPRAGRPAVLIPNPFYAAYAAGAIAADCEPVYLPATAATGFLPDLDALKDDLLARTVAVYLASPPTRRAPSPTAPTCPAWSGWRGASASWSSPTNAIARSTASSRRPECSKPRRRISPTSSYSTRCRNAPACRDCASDLPPAIAASLPPISSCATWPRRKCRRRCSASPSPPMAMRRTSSENRRFYREKFDLADQIVGGRYGYRRPAGGFFLWLDVTAQGGSEAATLALWREAGVRVVPGRYLAREQADGSNPGADYIRVAMVQNKEITAEALHRLVAVLG